MGQSKSGYFDERMGAWVTVCPPGNALGVDDLKNWSKRRSMGRSGSDGIREIKEEKKWKAGIRQPKKTPVEGEMTVRVQKRAKKRRDKAIVNPVDIQVCVHHETKPAQFYEGGLLVSLDAERDNAVWLRKADIDFERREKSRTTVTLPQKLALNKGLI